MFKLNRFTAALTLAVASAFTAPAFADGSSGGSYAPVNVSDGVAYLNTIDDSMMSIGLVMFALSAVAVGIKWVKATFFG